jgi:hypothetical protein
MAVPKHRGRANALTFAYAAMNADGSRIFDPASEDDLKAIGGMGFARILPVVQAAQRLSGLNQADVDNAVKNYLANRNGA